MNSSKKLPSRPLFLSLALLLCVPVLALAQDKDKKDIEDKEETVTVGKDGVSRFKSVKLKRITPDGLPKRNMMANSYKHIKRPKRLPTPPTRKQIKQLATTMHGAVHEVIALHTPPRPYRQVPMLYRGHAVWLSAHKDQSKPVLVSTLDWLSKAQEIYLVPRSKHVTESKQFGIKRSKFVTLSSMSSRSQEADIKLIQSQKKNYIKISRSFSDSARNLVVFKGVPAGQAPTKGLALFDPISTPMNYVYGFSPVGQTGLVATTVITTPPKEEALQYYFQTTFSAILGAPVASDQGEVIAINARRHPKNAGISLAVPPGALTQYVKERQNIKPEKKKLFNTRR